ncbi:deoxyguanosinetriphosphate triphosphohydrolase [Moraxella nasovis]|uniref:deoxyguanosinetriphosphate triphosphohydrolase n=1 Tax=Moraxella nasovis TaxID=2904121 RepID=UPI001F617F87|nr:deoxyguanosinetriphosphate triphosphohydrolase [Moraxella nasovis]UNU72514.1 deoxyguanosinetriphosphate triphosphohydrolase [Moraxella nasovis]
MSKSTWAKLLSTNRFKIDNGCVVSSTTHASLDGADVLRTDFHIDYDRVVFSSAFRRLGRKTQVHPFAKHDHTHNRLTHSVEVASVGRSLGNHVGVRLEQGGFLPKGYTPSDIGTVVQVACLAHDLGNPPFGHTGEEALRAWWQKDDNGRFLQGLTDDEIRDVTTYEGNAMSLRTLTRLEMYRHLGGMRLTSASLGTLLKYPWTSSHHLAYDKGKYNILQSELPLIQKVASDLGLVSLDDNRWARHPLSYLMEAADDICYALLDLEDAVELDLLSMTEFENILTHVVDIDNLKSINNPMQRRGAMRGIAIGYAIHDIANAFMKHHDELLTGKFSHKDLLAVSSNNVQNTLDNAKQIAQDKIFHHPSKITTEIASFGCLGLLLDLFIPAVHAKITGQPLTVKNNLTLKLMKDTPIREYDTLYTGYMKVLDFVGGMTDNRAATLARELSGVGMI